MDGPCRAAPDPKEEMCNNAVYPPPERAAPPGSLGLRCLRPSACPTLSPSALRNWSGPESSTWHGPCKVHGPGLRSGGLSSLIKSILCLPRALWSSAPAAQRLLEHGSWEAVAVFVALSAHVRAVAPASAAHGVGGPGPCAWLGQPWPSHSSRSFQSLLLWPIGLGPLGLVTAP